jgi:hypothetical protein
VISVAGGDRGSIGGGEKEVRLDLPLQLYRSWSSSERLHSHPPPLRPAAIEHVRILRVGKVETLGLD